jgi:GxxExxY protein
VSRRDAEDAESKGGQQEPEEGLNRLTEAVIGAAIEVHRVLGPGFLEALYEQALCLEFAERAIPFVRQVGVDVFYEGTRIGEARLDS